MARNYLMDFSTLLARSTSMDFTSLLARQKSAPPDLSPRESSIDPQGRSTKRINGYPDRATHPARALALNIELNRRPSPPLERQAPVRGVPGPA